jgi:glutamate--cysteine ligase
MSLFTTQSEVPVTSRNQLVAYSADACKPKSDWLIGCEHEKFPYRLNNLRPVAYDEANGLRDFMNGMKDFGWEPVMESENIIGLTRGKSAITFEPGGQVELAGAPLPNLHETSAENDQHLTEANEIGERLGIGFLGMGFHPTARREDIAMVPKERYIKIQKPNMPKYGSMGLDMMLRTCTVQVNLDYADEPDMVKKFRVSLALQPIATALFASSPFKEGKPNGFNSYRMHVWTDVDNARCGAPQFVFEDGFGFERYVDYALDVPMQFVYRDGHHVDCYGQSFRDFMNGNLPAMPGQTPIMGDWANHLTTLFPDVRMKKILEMRGADSGDAEMLLALPSFWVGILYDTTAIDAAWDLVKGWTEQDRVNLKADVPKHGLRAEVQGQTVAEIAQRAVTIAQQGLRRRACRLHGGADETRYLDILFNITESGQNRADQLLMSYENFDDFKLRDIFNQCRLVAPPKVYDAP